MANEPQIDQMSADELHAGIKTRHQSLEQETVAWLKAQKEYSVERFHKALQIGEMLVRAKEVVSPHEWVSWRATLQIGDRQIQRYRRCVKKRKYIERCIDEANPENISWNLEAWCAGMVEAKPVPESDTEERKAPEAKRPSNLFEVRRAIRGAGFECLDTTSVGGGFPHLWVGHESIEDHWLFYVKTPAEGAPKHRDYTDDENAFRESVKVPTYLATDPEEALEILKSLNP